MSLQKSARLRRPQTAGEGLFTGARLSPAALPFAQDDNVRHHLRPRVPLREGAHRARRLRRARGRRPPRRGAPRVRRSRLRRAEEGCVRRCFFHLVCGERRGPPARARVHARKARLRARRRCERRGVPAIASSFPVSPPPRRPRRPSSFSSGLHHELTTRHVFQIPLPTGPQPLRAVAEPAGATRSSPFTDVGVEELDPEVRPSDDPSPARLRPSPPPRRFEKPPPPPRRQQPPPVALRFLPSRT